MSRPPVRIAMVGLIGTILAGLVIVPAMATTLAVTGGIVLPTGAAWPGPDAIVVVTLIDTTNTTDSGNVIGQERIDGIGDGHVVFSVPFEADTIVRSHAYALFATMVEGGSTWQNPVGIPVITGGPVEGVALPVAPVTPGTGTIDGGIVLPQGTTLGPAAVVIAALIKQETGTLVSRQVQPTVTGSSPTFSVSFDPSLIDPAATYVVKAAVVDGASVWENPAGVPAIVGGATTGLVSVPVTLTTAGIPVASPFPTAIPSTTPKPTVKPSASVTPSQSASAAPSATPSPTPTPTPSPTPTPTPTPSPTPTAVPSASAVAPSGVLTGTLTYAEPHKLSSGAVAVVALVEGKGKATTSPIVATQIVSPAGQVPIAFKITYDPATIDPAGVYTLQAGIFDGDLAWVTGKGIPVVTNGVESGVAIPLEYRPDVAKGQVTGSVTGVGISLASDAYSLAVIVDVDSGASLGVDLTHPASLPAPFAIPFALSDIQSTGTYVVQAELTSGAQTWANAAGVPVITNGNPLSGVQVVVTAVAAPTPSPTPTAEPTPAPSPPPAGGSRLDGGALLLPLIIVAGLVVAGGVLLARSKDEPPPPSAPSAPSSTPDGD